MSNAPSLRGALDPNEIIVEMQHRHRLLTHRINEARALLINNIRLEEMGWTQEEAVARHRSIMGQAEEILRDAVEEASSARRVGRE